MKNILIAPLHYVIDKDESSEYQKAYDYLVYLNRSKKIQGHALVAYSHTQRVGNFKVVKMLNKKPKYISNFMRLRFILWIFIMTIKLQRSRKYDYIWHNGPFSLNETFSLVSLFNIYKTPIIIGPIPSPLLPPSAGESRSMGRKDTKDENKLNQFYKYIDNLTYPLAKSFKYLSYRTLKNANAVIALDNKAFDILKNMGIEKVSLIPAVIDISRFRFKNRRYAMHRKFLAVGYLIDRKHMEDIVKAFNVVVNSHKYSNIYLEIIGDGPNKKTIQKLIESYNLEKNVSLVGYINPQHINKYYENADVFISASTGESMAAVYFEAMACNLPIIAVDNNTTSELFENGLSGYLVKPRDVSQLSEAILDISTKRNHMLNPHLKNIDLLKDSYSLDKNMKKIIKLFSV